MGIRNKVYGISIAMFFILFNLGNVFAIQSEEIDLNNRFYVNPNKLEIINGNYFKFDLINRTGVDLKLSYRSEYCKIDLPNEIKQQKLKIKGYCEKSDLIEIFGNNDFITTIKVDLINSEIIEPPEIPEEPINTIKISSGRNLTQEGINRYGKENFYYILSRISMYSREYKLHNIYWKNSNIYDITYLCRTTEEGHKVYCILESINLNGDESDK